MIKKKYINADVLFCFYKQVDELQHSPDKISKIKARFLKNNVIPTIQNYKVENAEEVRYGEWIEKEHWIPLPRDYEVSYDSDYEDCYDEKTHSWKEKYWHCSCCDYEASRSMKPVHKYCPNCGAKMDKEKTEKE